MNNTTHSPVPQRFSGTWKTYRLGEIASFFKGSGNLLKTDLSLNAKRRCIHYGELFTTYGECITAVLHGTDREGTFFRSLRNDVLMPASDVTPNGLATASCISISDVILGGDILVIRVPEEILNGTFLAYIIRASHNQVMQLVSGTTVFHLYARDMANFRFIAPSVREQDAIVSVLSNLDAAIDASDALIAKKRAVKHAAMQQLLTGGTRLPGFSGEWKKTRMGRIGATYSGLSGKSKVDFGGGTARYVTFLGVLENVVVDARHTERVHVAPGESQNAVLVGDLLFNGSSETPGDLAMGAMVGEQLDNLYLNSFCFGFRVHDENEHAPLFLAYFFRGAVGRATMNALAQGATRYNLSKSQFLALELSIPACDEQRAIAAVLSDMDAEIEALERRRDKVRAIKQGMMQELLTGRVRLVKSG